MKEAKTGAVSAAWTTGITNKTSVTVTYGDKTTRSFPISYVQYSRVINSNNEVIAWAPSNGSVKLDSTEGAVIISGAKGIKVGAYEPAVEGTDKKWTVAVKPAGADDVYVYDAMIVSGTTNVTIGGSNVTLDSYKDKDGKTATWSSGTSAGVAIGTELTMTSTKTDAGTYQLMANGKTVVSEEKTRRGADDRSVYTVVVTRAMGEPKSSTAKNLGTIVFSEFGPFYEVKLNGGAAQKVAAGEVATFTAAPGATYLAKVKTANTGSSDVTVKDGSVLEYKVPANPASVLESDGKTINLYEAYKLNGSGGVFNTANIMEAGKVVGTVSAFGDYVAAGSTLWIQAAAANTLLVTPADSPVSLSREIQRDVQTLTSGVDTGSAATATWTTVKITQDVKYGYAFTMPFQHVYAGDIKAGLSLKGEFYLGAAP